MNVALAIIHTDISERKYMDKNLNDEIKALIKKNMITPNLCFLCLARLNEMIEYSNRSYDYLIPYRDAIAKVLIKNGVDKKIIGEKINTIHKTCYPTLNGSVHKGQIKSVYEMILTGEYTFVEETIPENWFKYKSAEEYKADMDRTPRKAKLEADERMLLEIVNYIEATFTDIPFDKINQEKINALKTQEYTYELIFDALKAYTDEINRSLWDKKGQEVGLFEYVLAIVKKKLPAHYNHIKQKEEQERDGWRFNSYCVYLGEITLEERVKFFCEQEQYNGKEAEVRARIERALKELHENESYRNICKREWDEMQWQNRPKAEYKRKTKDTKKQKLYEDLW